MHFNIISDSNKRISRKRIKELLTLIEEEEDPPDSTVNIIFIHDRQIVKLNREFRGRSGATDVLSFNLYNQQEEDPILGEIYISVDTAARNAIRNKISLTGEILHLCCHGFLHLLGFTHKTDKNCCIMQAKEKRYLEKAGL